MTDDYRYARNTERVGSFFPEGEPPAVSNVRTVYTNGEKYFILDKYTKTLECTADSQKAIEYFGTGLNVHNSKLACVKADTIEWEYDNPEIDGEGVTIPGECTDCGASVEYYFDKVGIYDPDNDAYITRD